MEGRATRIPTTCGRSTFDSGSYRPRTLIGAVGDIRYENVYQLDLRLEKTFNIGGVAIIPTVEVFNVTNNGAVLQRYELVGRYDTDNGYRPDALFNQIQETQSPAIMRLGMRINF